MQVLLGEKYRSKHQRAVSTGAWQGARPFCLREPKYNIEEAGAQQKKVEKNEADEESLRHSDQIIHCF